MENFRVGVVGCGGIAQVHGTVLQHLEGVELVGCADIKPEQAQAFAETYGGRAYSSMEELLENLAQAETQQTAEFINIFYGEDVDEESAGKALALFQRLCPNAEITLLSGGQPVYYYMISAE